MRIFLSLPLIALFLCAIGSCQDKEPADPMAVYWAQFKGNYSAVETCISLGGIPSPDTTYGVNTITIDSISPSRFHLVNGIFFFGGDSTHNVNSDTAYYHFVYSYYGGEAWLVKSTKHLRLKSEISNFNYYKRCFGEYDPG